MTAQKTITSIGVFASLMAALVSVWGYARSGDPYSLVSLLFFSLAGVFGVIQLRRPGPSDLGSFNPAGTGRTIAKFVGLAAACWLLIFVRVRAELGALLDPLNVLALLVSLVALILGLQFALMARESRRRQAS
ncbi:MAG TPA: hypothetical protein VII72_11050 [Myxococcota bacterium]|jgi:apolipoprotein N-acyltransferase